MTSVPDWAQDTVPDWAKDETPPPKDEGALTAGERGAVQGASFGFGDELTALQAAGGYDMSGKPLSERYSRALQHPLDTVGSLAKGAYRYWSGQPGAEEAYNEAVARERAVNKAASEQHPYSYGAGEVAGAIPSLAVAPEADLIQGAGRFTNAARMAVPAIETGAAYGALSGAGEGTDAESRFLGGLGGGMTGAVTGAAAPFIGATTGALYDRFGKPLVGVAKGLINPEKEAARRLTTALTTDQEAIAAGKANGLSVSDWVKARQAGEPVTLADLGAGNTQSLLRASAYTSPEGRALLEKVLEERFFGQTERVGDTIRGLVAGGANAGKTAEELVSNYNAGRGGLYKKAYEDGSNLIRTPTMERLMGSPAVTAAMKNAVTTGKDRAIAEGYGAFNPGVTINDSGLIQFNRGPTGVPQFPNLQYWDAVKRELDDMTSAAYRRGENGQGSVLSNLRNSLRDELDNQVPSYKAARGFAADFFGERDALQAGRTLAGKKVDPQVIIDAMKKMSPQEKDLFREGYASDWADRTIGNISDTRDLTKAMFNSPNERKRALAVFGQPGMSQIESRMALETIMDASRKAMGNSTTARQLIEAGLAGGALYEGYETGWSPIGMLKGAAIGAGIGATGSHLIAHQMARSATKAAGFVNGKVAKQVAQLLTSDDPSQLAAGMKMINRNARLRNGLNSIATRVALAGSRGKELPMIPGAIPAAADQDQSKRRASGGEASWSQARSRILKKLQHR